MGSTKNNVYLCCDDNAEHVVFSCYQFLDGDVGFEISIVDSYLQNREYTGFLGRCKRAWLALLGKPVTFASIYKEDASEMRDFLQTCIDKMDIICKANQK